MVCVSSQQRRDSYAPFVVCQGGPRDQEDTGVLGVGLGGTAASLLVTLALSGIIHSGGSELLCGGHSDGPLQRPA